MKGSKWTANEQARFLKGVGELLARGYPISEAMDSMSIYLEIKRKDQIKKSLKHMQEGYPFHLILHHLRFNRDLVSYVYFAEQHGGMMKALNEGSDMLLKRHEDFQRLKKLGAYPLFLLILTGIIFYFVDHILLPRFSDLFISMNISPNLFMKTVFTLASILPTFLLILFLALLIGVVVYLYFLNKRTAIGKREMLAGIPLAGQLVKLLYTHFFAVQLSYLFSGGLSIREALEIFKNNTKQAISSELGRGIIQKLAAGMDFDEAVTDYMFFEADLPKIIRHGQKNGKLDQELYMYSRHCLKQLEEKTDKAMKIFQPLLYSLIGLLIISLYLSILLPMFQMLQGI